MGLNASDVIDTVVAAISAYNRDEIDTVAVVDRIMDVLDEGEYAYDHAMREHESMCLECRAVFATRNARDAHVAIPNVHADRRVDAPL
jgi:hypothetical protein